MRIFGRSIHPTRYAPLRHAFLAGVGLLRRTNLHTKHGFTLHVPKSDRSYYTYFLWRFGEYERLETEAALSLVRPGDVAVDVGANVGYFTCLLGKAVGPQGRVYAFEPDPVNHGVLMRNIEMNSLAGCAVSREAALSDSTGHARLFMSDDNQGDHTLVGMPGRRTRSVPQLTFDDWLEGTLTNPAPAVKFVKVDVQGAEAKVLRGMAGSIEAGLVQNLLIEFTPQRVEQAGDDPSSFLSLLGSSFPAVRVLSHTLETEVLDLDDIAVRIPELSKDPFASLNLLATRNDDFDRTSPAETAAGA